MYLIDTNILVYHFNNSIPRTARARIHEIFKSNFNISIITKMEFLGFPGHTEDSFNRAKRFLEYAYIIELNEQISDHVVKIKRENKIKLPDAVIASSALIHKLTLVTRNQKDFGKLDISIYNPFGNE